MVLSTTCFSWILFPSLSLIIIIIVAVPAAIIFIICIVEFSFTSIIEPFLSQPKMANFFSQLYSAPGARSKEVISWYLSAFWG